MTASLALMGASIRGQMQYRSQFLVNVFMGLVYQGTGFFFVWVIVDRFNALAGWSIEEVAFLYSLRLLAHALYGLLFNGTARLYWEVSRGDFDRFLIRPLPSLLSVMSERFHVPSLGDLLGGVALLVAVALSVPVDWSVAALGYLVLAVLGGALVEAAVRLAATSVAFHTNNVFSINYLLDSSFATFGSYPLGIYTLGVRALLTYVLPVAFVAYFPASVLLGRTAELSVHPAIAYSAPLVGIGLFAASYLFWTSQLRHYKSAGH